MLRQAMEDFCRLVNVALPVLQSFRDGFGETFHVSIPRAFIRASIVVALTSVTSFATSASAQSPGAASGSTVAISEPEPGSGTANAGQPIVPPATPDVSASDS